MMPKRFGISNKVVFAFLSIGLILCMDIALGSTLDIYVYSGGAPASSAEIYVDGVWKGRTYPDGSLLNIDVAPGFHTVVASFDGRSKNRDFTAQSDSYTQLRIDM